MQTEKGIDFFVNFNIQLAFLFSEEGILGIFKNPPNQLAIAGLTIGVLLLVFLAILRLKIFPRLNQVLGAELIHAMMKYLFILALVSIVLSFLSTLDISIGTKNENRQPSPTPTVTTIIEKTSSPELIKNIKKVPITFDIKLKGAIEYIADIDGHPKVMFTNCNNSAMNSLITKQTYSGENHLDIIQSLQFHFNGATSKGLYSARFDENNKYYEITCFQ
ncbi:MAG: hypothetical protein LUM44_23145 [Pyrinomonadaceae bacterium]|nr:hypothetical protein [Pyrinomonadaceae bacterium]